VDYSYLGETPGIAYDVAGIDDVADFEAVKLSMTRMKLTPDEITSILRKVAGVLMLGNVRFVGKTIEGQDNAAELPVEGRKSLGIACDLLDLSPQKINDALTTTPKKIGGEAVTQRVTAPMAAVLRDSLAKAIYERLFHYIIQRLNATVQSTAGISSEFMGLLDIFGFEVFKQNSLEQLLINITNEYLQKNFVDVAFDAETKLYRAEEVSTAELVWTDNKAVIECLIGKKDSVFSMLEDCCLAPSSSDEVLVAQMKKLLKENPTFKEAKEKGTVCFTICHTIADINYDSTGFLGKNRDILKAELLDVVKTSSEAVMKQMFVDVAVERGKLAKGQLIASQFLQQLSSLMQLIRQSEPHFIRCVKPNEDKSPLGSAMCWNAAKVLNQLFSLSILEALQLKQLGYSYRRPFQDFCQQFRLLDPAAVDSDMDRKECAKSLLERSGLEPSEWTLGKTMAFMKPDSLKILVNSQREAMQAWIPTVNFLEAAWKRHSNREKLKELMPSQVRVQAHCRWYCYAAKGTRATSA